MWLGRRGARRNKNAIRTRSNEQSDERSRDFIVQPECFTPLMGKQHLLRYKAQLTRRRCETPKQSREAGKLRESFTAALCNSAIAKGEQIL